MKITILLENTTIDKELKPKHGLCVYIETLEHKILFDTGPDETYLHNAQKLGIDLSEVDIVVLSHGHHDHGGGLAGFLKVNNKAKIYIQKSAFEPHYAKVLFFKRFIGLDRKLLDNERFLMIDGTVKIDDELLIFSDVEKQLEANINNVLLKKTSAGYSQDDFTHEQSLIVTEIGGAALFTGCSHRGISNILRSAQKHSPMIQTVFGGFHLYNPDTKVAEATEIIQKLARELSSQDCVFYTCHCTGKEAFESMHEIMQDKLLYIATGTVIDI